MLSSNVWMCASTVPPGSSSQMLNSWWTEPPWPSTMHQRPKPLLKFSYAFGTTKSSWSAVRTMCRDGMSHSSLAGRRKDKVKIYSEERGRDTQAGGFLFGIAPHKRDNQRLAHAEHRIRIQIRVIADEELRRHGLVACRGNHEVNMGGAERMPPHRQQHL